MSVEVARRWIVLILAGLVAPLLLAAPTPPAEAAAAAAALTAGAPSAAAAPTIPGPAMLSPGDARARALTCTDDLEHSRRPPVLLVPGTSFAPGENWNPTYRPVLRARGHAVCMVRLPDYATRDMQANVEYVATAIQLMADRSHRKISTIGVSQGALLPHAALRTWPSLAAHVEDVIGLAGVYDRGSKAVAKRCRTTCLPVLHQMAAGSRFLRALHSRPLPDGPSYTNIGTRGDQTVTPQPDANRVPGATSIMLQDACPWRDVSEPEHAMLLGDAVALALALDALDHQGVASSRRLGWGVCFQRSYSGFSLDDLLSRKSHQAQLARPTRSEPALYCRDRRGCTDARQRGYVLSGTRITVGRDQVTLRARATQAGKVRLALGGRSVVESVQPGPVLLRLTRPPGPGEVVVATRTAYYRAWAVEARRRGR